MSAGMDKGKSYEHANITHVAFSVFSSLVPHLF